MREEIPWSRTKRGRRELLAAGLFVAANLFVPPVAGELYPFTDAALFSAAPRILCDYEILAPSGQRLPNMRFGVARQYWGLRGFSAANPHPHPAAIRLPSTIDRAGEVPSRAAVTRVIKRNLAALPGVDYVDVRQRILGAVDENRVGVVEEREWRVPNPAR